MDSTISICISVNIHDGDDDVDDRDDDVDDDDDHCHEIVTSQNLYFLCQ